MTRRNAFTLTELLIAAATTAMVAAAAATLASAVTSTAVATTDIRAMRSTGQYVVQRVGGILRNARAIGQVTETSVTIWIRDANGDDTVNLYECGILRYENVTKRLAFEYMESTNDPPPSTTVSDAEFRSVASLGAKMTGPDKKSVIWAEGVESLKFTGYPDYTNTQIVGSEFVIVADTGEMSFRVTASPRASANYLFDSSAQAPPAPTSVRKMRKKISKWTGLN